VSGVQRESWFDRLAVPRTRRQVLQAALAGAALTLPLARPARTYAASRAGGAAAEGPCKVGKGNGPHACQKGCFHTSNLQAQRRLDGCLHTAGGNLALAGYIGGLGFMTLAGASFGHSVVAYTCTEVALLQQKAMQRDCLDPNCPGFDPCGQDGPCEYCSRSGGVCCPDSQTSTGYSCCACCGPDPALPCSNC
jgi:hypothetical protein